MRLKASACTVSGRTIIFVAIFLIRTAAAQQGHYKKPSNAILDVMSAPTTPLASVSPSREVVLLYSRELYPPIAEVSQPFVRLAGLRIDVATNGVHNSPRFYHLILKSISDGSERKISLPPGVFVSSPVWSPDGHYLAFTRAGSSAIELWIVDVKSGTTHVIKGLKLNGSFGEPCGWIAGSKSMLCSAIPSHRGPAPAPSDIPEGPRVEESDRNATTVPTFEDLLKNPYDTDLFDYYATSQLVIVNVARGKFIDLGRPNIFYSAEPAPDGKYILIAKIHRPYSYVVRENDFPRQIEVWDLTGKIIRDLANLPLEDSVPIGGVHIGPRDVQWDAGEPATLVWAEALDGGNPKQPAPYRDTIMTLSAPFNGVPVQMAQTEYRFLGIYWSQEPDFAILVEFDRRIMHWRGWFVNPLNSQQRHLAWDLSIENRYDSPGQPLMTVAGSGQDVLAQNGEFVYFAGPGFSPDGAHPFLDRIDITTLHKSRIFQSPRESYEMVVGILNANGFLTRRESSTAAPNFYVHMGEAGIRQLTFFTDPTPQLRRIKTEIANYKRADGVSLSMTVYLPPDYKAGDRRPALLWAYPMEFANASLASQVMNSPNRFTMLSGASELYFLLAGYVVLDDASMPVIGSSENANNTFVQQITEDAGAAVEKAKQMGVIDPNRIGVGGESYGAFMTANLLAHTKLFRAGIAISGAYNRTLTPFGFQNERRTLWEAPSTYIQISPFMFADKITTPLLLIHGAADNNSGTFPIQSEMMYRAVQGNGGIVRYVLLPDESHVYTARESIEDVTAEMVEWFDKYVKHASSSP